jgi:pyrroline-5-carboxylate reductase
MKVLILGAGKMVEAILSGLSLQGHDLTEWGIYSPSGTSAQAMAGKYHLSWVKDIQEVKNPQWVMVGCKPQQLADLALKIKGLFPNSLFLSLLAALPEKNQIETLGITQLVRVMPNLAVQDREGVTLLSSDSANPGLESVKEIFDGLGKCLIVQEAELEELTLLTGSGPAFFYEFTHALAQSFSSLTSAEREMLARQVLRGAASRVAQSSLHLAELTNAVTSKGGVTIAVLEAWRSKQLMTFLAEGLEQGKRRAKEIARQFLQ